MENVWRRASSLLLGLFAVLSSGWVPASFPSSSHMWIFLSKLARLPSAPNQTSCLLIPSSYPWILNLLGCLGIQSSSLGQMWGCAFKCPFSFLHFPHLLHFDLRVHTPPILGWRPLSSFGLPHFPLFTSINFMAHYTSFKRPSVSPPELILLCFLYKDYFKTLINANTLVRKTSLWSLLSTFGYCFSSYLRREYERHFRDIISEHVGQGQIDFHPLHSSVLQYLVPVAKVFSIKLISSGIFATRTFGGGLCLEQPSYELLILIYSCSVFKCLWKLADLSSSIEEGAPKLHPYFVCHIFIIYTEPVAIWLVFPKNRSFVWGLSDLGEPAILLRWAGGVD